MDSLVLYAAAVGFVALLSGAAISYVVRGARARREKEAADAQIRELNERVAAATRSGTPAPASDQPKRWTVTEVVALVGAVGTLLGAIGTFRNTDQSRTVAELRADVTRLERERTELKTDKDNYERATLAALTYGPEAWQKLAPLTVTTEKRKNPVEVNISDRSFLRRVTTLSRYHYDMTVAVPAC